MGVGQWIRKGMVTFSLGMANLEEQILKPSKNGDSGGVTKVNPYQQNTLMRDLKEGRVTQQVKEFREHHYLVLQAAEKYKTKWGKDGDFRMLTEQEIAQNRVAQGDPYDSYPVEVTIDNSPISKSLFEHDSHVRPIKVRRGVFPNCKIEEHTSHVHIRNIDGKNKLIDFYIVDKPENRRAIQECRHLITNPGISDFNNIVNMNFTTSGGDMMMFEYKMLAFDKVVQHNGHYIVKMFAEVIKNGEWAAAKYMLD